LYCSGVGASIVDTHAKPSGEIAEMSTGSGADRVSSVPSERVVE
jgi:hypothetical protein